MNIIKLLYMESDLNNITKLYEKLNYLDQYGGSVILFIFVTIVVILMVSYFHIMSNIQPIIDDWPNQRCKPGIIPIAGLITHPEGVSAGEYTAQNFSYCTQNILSNITGDAVQPLTYMTNVLQTMANSIQNSIQSIRAMFDKVRTSMQNVSEEIMGRLMNTMIPLQQIIISFKDFISKIQGTLTSGLFTLLGSYYTLKSLLGAIVQFIIAILITLAVLIASFWAVPFTWGAAVANTVIFIALSIPLAIILAFMTNVLKIKSNYKIPKIKCFDKNTLITMNDGSQKKIIDIEVGDVLEKNNKVTAKIKVIADGSQMYNVNNVIVSDTHITYFNGVWLPVPKHPKAKKHVTYNEEFLYCLNTTKKYILINDVLFTDWDEIYAESLSKVLKNDIKTIDIDFKNEIHEYLDYGFTFETKVTLQDGRKLNIGEVKVNDVLENGEKVYGIVEIDGNELHGQYCYYLGENDNDIVEGYLPYLVSINKTPISVKEKLPVKHNKLFNLLTGKTFKIHNTYVPDYNDAIDRLLEKSI